MTNPKHTDTSRNGDLVKRLRNLELRIAVGANEACGEAADCIEALEAENKQLRVALWNISAARGEKQ